MLFLAEAKIPRLTEDIERLCSRHLETVYGVSESELESSTSVNHSSFQGQPILTMS